jgi:hypothetical protein
MRFFLCMGTGVPIAHMIPHFNKCSNYTFGKYRSRIAMGKCIICSHGLQGLAGIHQDSLVFHKSYHEYRGLRLWKREAA